MKTLLSREKLEKLNTKRLLAYKKAIMKYNENGCEFYECDCSDDQLSKSHPEWQRCYNDLKEILSTREHIEK